VNCCGFDLPVKNGIRIIVAVLVAVASVLSGGCQQAQAAKPLSTTSHTVKVIRYCFY
jgi:hypothetical protein